MYYAFIIDNELYGKGQCPMVGENVQNVELTEEVYNNLDHYIWNGEAIVLNPNYEEEQAQKEQERVNNLTMTALDFITFLRQAGISLEAIRSYLDSNIELDTQLKYCQNVYCGVVKQILPKTIDGITVTKEMAEYAFKLKNGEINDKLL